MQGRQAGGLSICALTMGLLPVFAAPEPLTWHVSPSGSDEWSGQRPDTEGQGTAGPMRSFGKALAASRELAGKARRIVLGRGRHYLEETVILDARDEGLTIEGAGAGQTILHGGRRITGWRKDGGRFLTAAVPAVAAGAWDFRALVVNDRLCPRARLPETGRFEHESRFPVRWMSTAGGGWERKPTETERTTLQYRPGDLGVWLSVRNAEVTVYHMWDESMVGVSGHDPATRMLTFSNPCGHPPGAFGVKTYVVWNMREGMKRPGQWYLDRDEGRIVYWPLPGEDMGEAVVVAPRVETIIELRGVKSKPVQDVTLRGLTLSTTTTPCKAGGFGANKYRGALHMAWGENVRILDVEITNTAGHAIREWGTRDIRVEDCDLHHLGAGGCRMGGGSGRIEGNRIHHVGMLYPSAIGLSAGGRDGRYVIRRNEIHHTTYSGMAVGGAGTIIEENLLYRCMQELHDGAAIYVSGARGNVIRRNVARDIVETGKGYGVSSYYLDEKCRDCVVERNVSMGVARPSHNHMTLNCIVRDNVFVCEDDMTLSFNRCSGHRVTGNTLVLGGELTITDPDAVSEWQGNLVVRSGEDVPALSDAMPRPPRKPRETPRHANAGLMSRPPVLDGSLPGAEWPPGGQGLGDLPDQRRARGAPVVAKLCADRTDLYLGVSVVTMFPEERKLGSVWGQDEGVEITVEGSRQDGTRVVYVLRGFADGSTEGATVAGASAAEVEDMRKAVGYASAVEKHVWRSEWKVPFATLGFEPSEGAPLPMNVTVYRSEDGQYIQWAGTLGETWELARGGRLAFPGLRPDGAQRPKPIAVAARLAAPPVLDGKAVPGEWPETALRLSETPGGARISGTPCAARVATDGTSLFVRVAVPTAGPDAVRRGREWRRDDGAEVCVRGRTSAGKPVTWVLHGFASGVCEASPEAGAPAAGAARLGEAVLYAAAIDEQEWHAEWAIPLGALGVVDTPGSEVPFNLGVYRSAEKQWINWVGTRGPTWKLENGGVLRFGGESGRSGGAGTSNAER